MYELSEVYSRSWLRVHSLRLICQRWMNTLIIHVLSYALLLYNIVYNRFIVNLLASLTKNYFPKQPSGAHLCQNYMMFYLVLLNPSLRLCIALFAVAEGCLLLDILFMYTQQHNLRTAYSTKDCKGKWIAIY